MKKITLYFFVLMNACILNSSAQTFQNIIGTKGNQEYGLCSSVDADGNLYVGGQIWKIEFPATKIPFVAKLNSDGTVKSMFTIRKLINEYGVEVADMEALHNAAGNPIGFVVIFQYYSDAIIATFDNSGKVLWAKSVPSSNVANHFQRIKPIYSSSNNLVGFYTTVNPGYNDNVLLKFSADGNLLWQRQTSSPKNREAFYISDILTDNDGGCVVVGNTDIVTDKPVIMKFSRSGKLVWGNRYVFFPTNNDAGAYISAIAAAKGGYILSGSINKYPYTNLTFKVDKGGNIVWAHKYSLPYYRSYLKNIVTDYDGNILLAGARGDIDYYENDTSHNAYIVKLDSTGNIIFGKQYYFSAGLNDIEFTKDGYFAVGNTVFSDYRRDLYVIKTDTSGNIGGNCINITPLNITKKSTKDSLATTPHEITNYPLTATDVTLVVNKIDNLPQDWCGTDSPAFSKAQKQISSSTLSIAPNPSQGIVTATCNSTITGRVQLNVYDKTGKIMFTKTQQAIKGKNTYQLNLSNLINGLYNLQLNNAREQSQVKFVIEK